MTQVSSEFTHSWTIRNNGECLAIATVLTNQLPAEMQFVDATYTRGTIIFDPALNRSRFVCWSTFRDMRAEGLSLLLRNGPH